jgi:hypothetical protein
MKIEIDESLYSPLMWLLLEAQKPKAAARLQCPLNPDWKSVEMSLRLAMINAVHEDLLAS